MKPIETRYAGCRFRSRLEARWAVYFDNLGIAWHHEPQAFVLSTGEGYLPDFHLPRYGGGMYVEVKPMGDPSFKAKQLAAESGHMVLLANGPPSATHAFKVMWGGDGGRDVDCTWAVLATGSPYFDPEDMDEQSGELGPSWATWHDMMGTSTIEAVEAALSARFEPRKVA
jgi:hypothetical protein